MAKIALYRTDSTKLIAVGISEMRPKSSRDTDARLLHSHCARVVIVSIVSLRRRSANALTEINVFDFGS